MAASRRYAPASAMAYTVCDMKYAARALLHTRDTPSYTASHTLYTCERCCDAYTALLRGGARIVFVSEQTACAARDIAYRRSAIIYAADS
jgi:hypothetical protein